MKFCPEILRILGYHTVQTRSLYLTWAFERYRDVTPGRTDGQRGGQNYRS